MQEYEAVDQRSFLERREFFAYDQFIEDLILDNVSIIELWLELEKRIKISSRHRECVHCREKIRARTKHHVVALHMRTMGFYTIIRVHTECLRDYIDSFDKLEKKHQHWEEWHEQVFV